MWKKVRKNYTYNHPFILIGQAVKRALLTYRIGPKAANLKFSLTLHRYSGVVDTLTNYGKSALWKVALLIWLVVTFWSFILEASFTVTKSQKVPKTAKREPKWQKIYKNTRFCQKMAKSKCKSYSHPVLFKIGLLLYHITVSYVIFYNT